MATATAAAKTRASIIRIAERGASSDLFLQRAQNRADGAAAPADRVDYRVFSQTADEPFHIFFAGLELVQCHSFADHAGFLLGEFRDHGWWYYFPVVLFFKTPLAFLLLALIGMARLITTRDPKAIAVAIMPLAMLLPAMTTGINIGVRHVLPVYRGRPASGANRCR